MHIYVICGTQIEPILSEEDCVPSRFCQQKPESLNAPPPVIYIELSLCPPPSPTQICLRKRGEMVQRTFFYRTQKEKLGINMTWARKNK